MNIDSLFTTHPNSRGFIAKIPTKSGKLILSLVAGYYFYSEPRKDLDNISEYTKLELAVFNKETCDWASYNEVKEIIDIIGDKGEYEDLGDGGNDMPQSSVFGYVDKELIIKIIENC